jgi:chorismate--pyruvate lyase
MNPALLSWLTDRGSLTARLKGHCPGRFSLRVLGEQWVRPDPSEARLLKVRHDQKVLLRQVHLLCGGQLCVYARSVIPLTTLKGKHRRLLFLGDRPLGEYLFASPTLERGRIEWGSLSPGSVLYQTAMPDGGSGESVWGRRSLFRIDDKPLLVSEFFLPVLFNEELPA